jgi:hypothetical protein
MGTPNPHFRSGLSPPSVFRRSTFGVPPRSSGTIPDGTPTRWTADFSRRRVDRRLGRRFPAKPVRPVSFIPKGQRANQSSEQDPGDLRLRLQDSLPFDSPLLKGGAQAFPVRSLTRRTATYSPRQGDVGRCLARNTRRPSA